MSQQPMSDATPSRSPLPARLVLGDHLIQIIGGGGLWLDGGAMFGIIPKPMWSRLVICDEQNRIPLATRSLLMRVAGQNVLIETGVGPAAKYSEKEREFFKFGDRWLLDSLGQISVDPETVDYVILTHLHFDHAGGATVADGQGGYNPTFPRAKYIIQRGEWQDAVSGRAVMSRTYREENLAPLERDGLLSLVDGDAEILPGLRIVVMPGHTRYQQSVIIDSAGKRLVHTADLMPTSAHVGLRYNMGYDLLPYENMENKRRLLSEAAEKRWILLTGQDPNHPAWEVQRQSNEKFELSRVETPNL